MHSSILALGLAAFFNGAFAQNNSYSRYSLKTTYDSSNFFEAFEFFNEEDPTHGFVDYVDADAANSEGLAGYVDGAVYMGVDYQTKNPSNGRRSVRVTSHDAFTHGLFVADIAHMPGSIPGVWPAYWMFGPNWPTSGEIDILEGVNTQTENKISLHTGPGCSITNDGTTQGTTLESENCDSAGASAGCGQNTSDNQNYGDGFNDIGGGVYATEWTSERHTLWFFHRGRRRQDIQSGNPTPSSWGPPAAKFNGGKGCNIDDHFKENNIVFDTTFCGDWAGSPDVWGKNPETSSLGDCKDYVANNPADFKNAYWLVNSIKVYVQGGSYGGGNGTTGGGNSGSGNSGSGNSGNGNSGNGNSGNGNSGNGNSGNGNSGNGNSGNGTRVMETRATETVAMATVVTARAETVMARPTHPAVLSQDKALRTVSKVRTVMDTLLTVNKAKTKATAIPLSNSKAKAVATALAKVTIMANTMAPEPTRPPSPNQAAPQAGTETVGESGPSDPSSRSDILHEQVELLFFTNI
ncbi:endo-1,3(4)-beta-glucanase [Fusarium oxysporum f. sp. lycopersici 4287]|uniref:endo-1,3(4)-beta-glucanase n=2 Tax=Fusarium oxysporum TaxID=5507 RepID=A0A0J9UCC2_FUSO4|nr:endo-1,3(4)-beta-glucanase [Fusarium oxysporum f. sp. lycopersici 4287]KNA97018.1 endo-1,3(4)-beta-glucanase [Fusarium oxysporum f. sp. lycopersici 4287]